MTELSPAALAVLDAIDFEEMNGPQQIVAMAHAAAALRAAADQVAPADYQFHTGKLDLDIGIEDNTATIRGELLAIAAELEGAQ